MLEFSDSVGRNESIKAQIDYVSSPSDSLSISYKDRNADAFEVKRYDVEIRNGRLMRPCPTIEREGFMLATHTSEVVQSRRSELIEENTLPRDDMAAINSDYANELIPLIKSLTGARDIIPQFGTTQVRFSNRAAHRSWMGTSAFAHMDFASTQVEKLIEQTIALTGVEIAPYNRQMLIQTWRVITDPPQDMPLTICDGRTVAGNMMIPLDFHGPEGSRNELVQSRVCRYDASHQWSYFPAMTSDEVLIFKGFDSACPEAMNAMHTAFDDPTVVDAIPRGSIECRFIAFFD
ncbi:CmcJ/NvfI family oxidoreductase [Pseudomonas silesiensis]|uniref:CmcJ/NvfI family oxidoreductase n=1 Tax=Pseudomonas silesiensis TaxID=1853130 RepID=UPI0034D3BD6F